MLNVGKLRVGLVVVAAACVAFVGSGCSTQAQPGSSTLTPREIVLQTAKQAQDAGYTDQYEALKDGEVTSDEYDQAFHNLADCYKASGVGVTTPVVNPVDGFSYLFESVGNGLDSKKVEQVQTKCLNEHWMLVSAAYNTVTPPRMDDALRIAVMSCLNSHGFKTTSGEKNLSELGGPGPVADERHSATVQCVGDEAFKLYPNLPPINLLFN